VRQNVPASPFAARQNVVNHYVSHRKTLGDRGRNPLSRDQVLVTAAAHGRLVDVNVGEELWICRAHVAAEPSCREIINQTCSLASGVWSHVAYRGVSMRWRRGGPQRIIKNDGEYSISMPPISP
jgi:hypothetical protein